MIRIIIDSACDMPKKEADALKLDYLPLKTIFGEEEFLDGITITHDEFYTRLENSTENPSTSQISPAEYEDVYEDVKKVAILLSSSLYLRNFPAHTRAQISPVMVMKTVSIS